MQERSINKPIAQGAYRDHHVRLEVLPLCTWRHLPAVALLIWIALPCIAITPPELGKDIYIGSTSSLYSMPSKYTEPAGDYLFFAGIHETDGESLWKSNGTDFGTTMVKDIRPNSPLGNLWFFASLGQNLFCGGNDGTRGFELWRSDGTDAGTIMQLDTIQSHDHSGWDAEHRMHVSERRTRCR